jgi:uncharacterized membrane protein YcaP (DUF421 family)
MDTFYYLVGQDADPIAWWQMCVRASIIFVWAVILYRLLPRRAFGSNAAADMVVAVILGSSLSRALTGNAPLLPTIAATSALALLYSLLTALSWRMPLIGRLAKGRPILLIAGGELDGRAMRRAQLGEHDLMENLRAHGLTRIDQVSEAWLERNGRISIITKC